MNNITATRTNWLSTDTADGNAIVNQPWKDVQGDNWYIETVGNVTTHTTTQAATWVP